MKTLGAVAAAFLCAGCTAPNPLYAGAFGPAGGTSDGGAQADDAGVADDAGREAPPDLGKDAKTGCVTGTRKCSSAGEVMACVGGAYQLDRACAKDSKCAGGHCQPPPKSTFDQTGSACDENGGPRNVDCERLFGPTLACVPYLVMKQLSWVCTPPFGAGTAGSPCTHGGECESGLCGDSGTCFYACQSSGDCPGGDSGSFRCDAVSLVVEGVDAQPLGCVPN
jgi:hypothetical protein